MEYGGVILTDAPDPSVESESRLRGLDFPVFQLKPQPSLSRVPITGYTESNGAAGQEELSVSFTYTLWKYPDDHSDPRNEIEMDERTRRSEGCAPRPGRPRPRFFNAPMS